MRISGGMGIFPPSFATFGALVFMAAVFFVPYAAADGEMPLRRLTVATPAAHNRQAEWVYRLPQGPARRVLVLFGGRNWNGEKSIRNFRFTTLADSGGAVLLAPSFRDDDYWEPAQWSGAALLTAVTRLKEDLGIHDQTLEMYAFGYSAGAQCVALFTAWKPQLFRGVAMHACGVFPPGGGKSPGLAAVPWLVTCGEKDAGRFPLSYTFVQQLREAGGKVIFRNYNGGHELPVGALRLAAGFLADLWAGKTAPVLEGEDFRAELRPICAGDRGRYDPELRNYFGSPETAELWRSGK